MDNKLHKMPGFTADVGLYAPMVVYTGSPSTAVPTGRKIFPAARPGCESYCDTITSNPLTFAFCWYFCKGKGGPPPCHPYCGDNRV